MDQTELLQFVSDALDRHGVVHGFTGSQASSLYGENRFTNDIDVVVDIRSRAVLDTLLADFPSDDFYVSEIGARHAVDNGGQFNIIHQDSSQKIDLIVQSNPAWPDELVRRVQLPLPSGRLGWFVSPEDLILHKMKFYLEGGSDKHLRDIAGMLRISGERVDRSYVEAWVGHLGLAGVWRAVLEQLATWAKRQTAEVDDVPPF